MANVYISEYREMAKEYAVPSSIAAAQEPALVDQAPIANPVASTQSSAFSAGTRFVLSHTDGIVSSAFGTNPTATTSSKRMAANTTEYFGVRPGDKVACINNT